MLWDYYLGIQDIQDKIKHTRDEINNKKVENWAYAMVDFKKAWQLGLFDLFHQTSLFLFQLKKFYLCLYSILL